MSNRVARRAASGLNEGETREAVRGQRPGRGNGNADGGGARACPRGSSDGSAACARETGKDGKPGAFQAGGPHSACHQSR